MGKLKDEFLVKTKKIRRDCCSDPNNQTKINKLQVF